MAGSQTILSKIKKPSENGNGLILYQYYPSFYCQKVVFALHEKKLKFKSRIVNLQRGEQFEPWFIKLNPKSEVPVLKDGVKIIPDSRRIIDYIEDNFSNGDTPRLMPEKGSVPYQVMERMRDLIDNLPMQIVTFGCVLNPHLTGEIKLPPQEIKVRQTLYAVHNEILTELCEKYHDFRDYYLVKKSNLERSRIACTNANEVEKALLDVEFALNEVEKVLESYDGGSSWLCCDKFTVADVSLCVLLLRLERLGLTDKFFAAGRLPRIQEYLVRARRRDAFRRTAAAASAANPRRLPLVLAGGGAALAALLVLLLLRRRH